MPCDAMALKDSSGPRSIVVSLVLSADLICIYLSLVHLGRLVHKRCALRWMQLLPLRQRPKNITINSFDAERWGSSVGAIDEEEEAK